MLRMFGEPLTKYICALEEMDETKELTQVERLSQLQREDLLTDEIVDDPRSFMESLFESRSPINRGG